MVKNKQNQQESSKESENVSESDGVKKPAVKKSEALWMMTFADLSFILMCFFVLLMGVQKTDKEKFDRVRDGLGGLVDKDKPKKNLATMKAKIERELKKKKLEKVAEVVLDEDGLAIEFKDKLIFKSGSARPSPKFIKVTKSIMRVVAKSPKRYKIAIEGHTDETGNDSRNWKLSSDRALALLNQFKIKHRVSPDRMKVAAFASTKPKVETKGKKGRALAAARAANRRVVIRLE